MTTGLGGGWVFNLHTTKSTLAAQVPRLRRQPALQLSHVMALGQPAPHLSHVTALGSLN